MAEFNIIVIDYSFLLRPSEYTGSKSNITLFRLRDTAFSCGRNFFVAIATASKLPAANFVTLTFSTHKNGVGGGKYHTQGIQRHPFVS